MFWSPSKVETNSTNITDPYHCNDQVGERVVISICTTLYKMYTKYVPHTSLSGGFSTS